MQAHCVPRTRPTAERALARLIARRLKELRAERGWNLWDVAERTDGQLARSTIGNFESLASFPSIPALIVLARALDVHPAELLLDPKQSPRDAVATAVLRAADSTIAALAAQLGSV